MGVIILKPKRSKDNDKRKYIDLSIKTKRYRFYRNSFFISLLINITTITYLLWLWHSNKK